MAVRAVNRGISVGRNGVGAFVLPCKRITFRFCNHSASSAGMREFLHKNLAQFAADNRGIEILVKQQHGHPVVIGEYMNGRTKPICVRNMSVSEISNRAQIVRDSSGKKLKRNTTFVSSTNESPRGIWSPFHVLSQYRFKV
ncbi:mitochondrial 54S ribosomal protein mL43 [Lipomyces oligophaga]|uniref:mitochondrial 54S ribosomal protein mL43 n=1 Tax=Lipomyces oligophaga TaxID=45792 RepID=UPI0034CE90D4